MTFDDNWFYNFYFYVSPLLTFFLIGILIILVIRNYYNVNLIQKEEEKKFLNFFERIKKEKEKTLNNCLQEQINISYKLQKTNNQIKEYLTHTFNQLKQKEKLNEEKIKELEKEVIKYKNICSDKVKQINRLKTENSKLKNKLKD